jgi:hypothetical protein
MGITIDGLSSKKETPMRQRQDNISTHQGYVVNKPKDMVFSGDRDRSVQPAPVNV